MQKPRTGIVSEETNSNVIGCDAIVGANVDGITADGVNVVVSRATGASHNRERML